MSDETTSGYELTRKWFDFAFENPDQVSANDTALYLWLVELNNRLGWSEKFGITRQECMLACGFKSFRPYKNALENLIKLGFIQMITKSKNQYQCNIIAVVKKQKQSKSKAKALDIALQKQSKSKGNIHLNTETPKHRTVEGGEQTSTHPTLEEVKSYFTENGYTDQIALRAFEYYSSTGWKDKNGKPVQNWKSKMVNVWFRDEHKAKRKFHPSTGLPDFFVP